MNKGPVMPWENNPSIKFSCLFWNSHFREYSIETDAVLLYEMSTEYHVDVLVSGHSFHTFGAGRNKNGSVRLDLQPDNILTKYFTENISIHVKDPDLAIDWLEDACNTKAIFKLYHYEFLLPETIMDIIEKDDDCTRPETWKHIFCSKFVLLFLRYCHLTGNLEAPEGRLRILWTVNSNHCTPAYLKKMVQYIFHPEQCGYR